MKSPDCTDRILRDLAATAQIAVTWRWLPGESLEVWVDERPAGSVEPAGLDCSWLADQLQDQHIIEHLGIAWPRCIAHARHPMVATRRDDLDAWQCPRDPSVWTPIGELTLPFVEEPAVADDHVRWWNDRWGWGVVARSDGDVCVHFSAIEGSGFRSLKEDQHVACSTQEDRQGAGFARRATAVKVIN